MIRSHEIDARYNAGVGSVATRVQDTNGHECNVLRDAVSRTADCARHVCAVTVSVVGPEPIVNGGETGNHAAGELRVRGADSCIDDVGFHA